MERDGRDILEIGRSHSADTSAAGGGAPARVRLRAVAESALIVALAATAIATYRTHGSPRARLAVSPGATQAAVQPVSEHSQSTVNRQLVAPATAEPGERVYLTATRGAGMCGTEELRFDDQPVAHRILTVATPANSATLQIFMIMIAPATARPGPHEIALYGPMPGARGGPTCGDSTEHHGRIATSTITIASPALARH